MRDLCAPIGQILRDYREELGITQESLARRAKLSKSMITKIERSDRPVNSATIAKLAPILELSESSHQRLLWLVDPHLRRVCLPAAARRTPTRRELSVLQANQHPAAFIEPGLAVIIAANPAFIRAFPGLRVGDSMVEWQLLNPWAKGVLAAWKLETHLSVRACREALTGFVPNSRIEAIKARLREASEFDEMWNSRVPKDYVSREILQLRDPHDDANTVRETYVRVSTDDSPWQHYALSPA
ncbi:helix-turn-helix domain-containing protein (plasmid) [Nocardia sp. CA-084685]|uniref:helix-turn-helix domain-containing protein n=1 Tax=Nocardia sp. CA-084685 TaxID=3239970 RepID=UPI003D9580ED